MEAALIGGLAGGLRGAVVGGLVSLVVQTRDLSEQRNRSRDQHEHELALAREERRHVRLASAYERMLRYAFHVQDWVN